jgi:multidrug efflux pump subunit AcrA (membrane-fusion protein)
VRSELVKLNVPNADGRLKAGMYAQVLVALPIEMNARAVPTSAVFATPDVPKQAQVVRVQQGYGGCRCARPATEPRHGGVRTAAAWRRAGAGNPGAGRRWTARYGSPGKACRSMIYERFFICLLLRF